MINYSYYLAVDQSHDYVTSIESTSNDNIQGATSLTFQLTYRSLKLVSSNGNRNNDSYTVSVWGENDSYNSQTIQNKLVFNNLVFSD